MASGTLTGLVCAAALLWAPALAVAEVAGAETDLVTSLANDYNPMAPLVQEPEGHPAGDYNPEARIMWADQSVLPVSVECTIPCDWIGTVTFMPLAVISMEGNNIKKTQVVTSQPCGLCSWSPSTSSTRC